MAGSDDWGRPKSDKAMLPRTSFPDFEIRPTIAPATQQYAPYVPPIPRKPAAIPFTYRLTFVLTTIAKTAASSLGVSAALAILFSTIATMLAPLAMNAPAVWSAVTTPSLAPLAPLWPGALFVGVAAGVGLEALRSMSGYVLRRRAWTLKKLRALIPSVEVLKRATSQTLSLYVGGLRTATFTAYLCEIAFQIVALGLVIWAVEAATPSFSLFANPEAATPWASIVFLVETALDNFGLKDALGATWTPLTPAAGVPFSLAMWVFQVFLIGVLVRELWAAWRLKPAEISEDLDAAMSR